MTELDLEPDLSWHVVYDLRGQEHITDPTTKQDAEQLLDDLAVAQIMGASLYAFAEHLEGDPPAWKKVEL